MRAPQQNKKAILISLRKAFNVLSVASCFIAGNAFAGNFWQMNNLAFLEGTNYELGDRNREIITYEHANDWKYGDTFFFTDVSFLHQNNKHRTEYYGEIQPRFSLGKITGNKPSLGIFEDILLATQMEFGKGDILVYLYGLGTNIKLPGFTCFQLNAYVRDNSHLNGATYQITTGWDYLLGNEQHKGRITGYVDWAGGEDMLKSNVTAVSQFLWDIGNYWQKGGHTYAGVEYQYWHNKYGVDGIEEHAPQLIVKYIF